MPFWQALVNCMNVGDAISANGTLQRYSAGYVVNERDRNLRFAVQTCEPTSPLHDFQMIFDNFPMCDG